MNTFVGLVDVRRAKNELLVHYLLGKLSLKKRLEVLLINLKNLCNLRTVFVFPRDK